MMGFLIYTVSQKTCDYIFYNNFNNKCPITIIFGIVSSNSMCYRKMVSLPTSPSATTLPWEITEHQKNDKFRRSGTTGSTSDSRSEGRGFDSH